MIGWRAQPSAALNPACPAVTGLAVVVVTAKGAVVLVPAITFR
jgi:hypothetical protein